MGNWTCEFGKVHKTCRCTAQHKIKCDIPDLHQPEEIVTGQWTHKESLKHKCELPQWDASVSRLDRWKCAECNKEWIVTSVNSDGRNGAYLSWRDYESWKSGPFAPGTK